MSYARSDFLLLPLSLTKLLVLLRASKKGLANKTSMLQSRRFGSRVMKEQGGFWQDKK